MSLLRVSSWQNCNLFYTPSSVAKNTPGWIFVLLCDLQTLFTFNLSIASTRRWGTDQFRMVSSILSSLIATAAFEICVSPQNPKYQIQQTSLVLFRNEYKGRPERSGAAGGVCSTDVRKGDSLLLPHFALQAPIWASAWRVIIEKCYSNLHKHPMFLKTYSSTKRWERTYGRPCSYCIPLEILLWESICKNAKEEQMIHQKYISRLKLKPVAR